MEKWSTSKVRNTFLEGAELLPDRESAVSGLQGGGQCHHPFKTGFCKNHEPHHGPPSLNWRNPRYSNNSEWNVALRTKSTAILGQLIRVQTWTGSLIVNCEHAGAPLPSPHLVCCTKYNGDMHWAIDGSYECSLVIIHVNSQSLDSLVVSVTPYPESWRAAPSQTRWWPLTLVSTSAAKAGSSTRVSSTRPNAGVAPTARSMTPSGNSRWENASTSASGTGARDAGGRKDYPCFEVSPRPLA